MVVYPKTLAMSDRQFQLTVVSGGAVGPEIDGPLVDADSVT